MKISEKSIEECLNHMDVDWMPFHDIYRTLFGFTKEEPTQLELESTLQLIEILLKDYGVICLKGPEMIPLGESTEDSIEKIRLITETEIYKSFDYGLWFDKFKHKQKTT